MAWASFGDADDDDFAMSPPQLVRDLVAWASCYNADSNDFMFLF
jgi:hypothetical protein